MMTQKSPKNKSQNNTDAKPHQDARYQRAHAKYGKLSDVELAHKVENRNFWVYGGILTVFFAILIASAIAITLSELPPAVETITIVLVAAALIFIATRMDKFEKNLKLDCQIEQQYRIDHPESTANFHNLKIKSKSQIFEVNKSKKKQTSLKNLIATFGGKVAAGCILILLLATIIVPIYLRLNGYQIAVSLGFNDPEFEAATFPWAAAAMLLCCLIAGVSIFLRQRGRNNSMRINEYLELDHKMLIYTYSMKANRWYPANGKTLVAIDLEHTTATYDKQRNLIIFQGQIATQLLTNNDASAKSLAQTLLFPIDRPIRPNADGTAPDFVPDGTNKKGYFEIYDYFDPTLIEVLGLK